MRIDQRDIYKIRSLVKTEMPNVFRLFVHSIVDVSSNYLLFVGKWNHAET